MPEPKRAPKPTPAELVADDATETIPFEEIVASAVLESAIQYLDDMREEVSAGTPIETVVPKAATKVGAAAIRAILAMEGKQPVSSKRCRLMLADITDREDSDPIAKFQVL